MTERSRLPGIYVHIPFCKTKCPYCDFYSVTNLSLVDAWLVALEKEMTFYKGLFPSFDSLYLGGGTPTILTEQQLIRLMSSLRDSFKLTPDSEITIEANPDDIDANKFEALRSIGINRLSIGVQSFNDEELLFLKRRHTAQGAEQAISLAKSLDFHNLGIDLMYGLYGQTLQSWKETLHRATGLEPAHLSCYQFTLAERTPFGKLYLQGKLQGPREEEERRFFLLTTRFLETKGFLHYEVSNFARNSRSLSRHNTKYWRHVPYLSLGPAAHSFSGRTRWWNHRSLRKYCEALEVGEKPIEGKEDLSEEQLRLERIYLGFRTMYGIDVQDLNRNERSWSALRGLVRSGYLKQNGDRIVATRRGYLIADRLPLLLEA